MSDLTTREKWILAVAFIVSLVLLGMTGMEGAREPKPTIVKSFEDGSHVWSDGTVSCDPGALCDEER
jgi:hypothetical protein